MANAPKNRMEVQVVWKGGYWRMSGPDKGRTWSRAELITQLREALKMAEQLDKTAAERGV